MRSLLRPGVRLGRALFRGSGPRSTVRSWMGARVGLTARGNGARLARGFCAVSSADFPVIELTLPALSPTMDSGAISEWTVKEGDAVEAGSVVAQIQTDKAVVDFEIQDDGFLAAITAEVGKEYPVGQPVAYIVEEEGDIPKAQALAKQISDTAQSGGGAAAPVAEAATAPTSTTSTSTASSAPRQDALLPATAALVRRYEIDPSSIPATGPKGHLLKGDVLKALASGNFKKAAAAPSKQTATATPAQTQAEQPAPAPRGRRRRGVPSFEDKPLTTMRKVIASRLTESKQTVPHAYATARCDTRNLLALRGKIKASSGSAPSLNDFVIKAVALALRDVPEANSVWSSAANAPTQVESVDISVAVATDDGLITPIVTGADQRSLGGISSCVRDLAGRAREKKLLPEEFQGGSFTISNLGMFGIDQFVAVINPPQACILAVGGGKAQTVPGDSPGSITTADTMRVTLSSDERCVDQATGARFLAAFQGYIEDPSTMLL